MSAHRPFYLLVAGAFALLTVSRALQAGMFVDGVTYAAISRNLAAGRGTFWSPSYTATIHPSFHEQPPLGFAIESAVFTMLGDHLAVERLYSTFAGAVVGLLLLGIWRRIGHDSGLGWLPLVFWFLPPASSWSIVNNMLDVTQAVFTTYAVLAFVRSLDESPRSWMWAASAGMAVAAAVLTKGPTGLFPLALPVIAALLLRGRSAASLKSGAVMVATLAVVTALFLVGHTSRLSLHTYWDVQIAASIRGDRGGAGRLGSMVDYFVLPVLVRMGGLSAMAWVASRAIGPRAGAADARAPRGWTLVLLVLAFAASLPIAISARIAGHYFVPSIPLFALGCASLSVEWIGPALAGWQRRRIVRGAVTVLGVLLCVATFTIPALGRSLEPRDVAWIREYRQLSPSIPRGVTMGTCDATREDWGLHAYMQRLFEVSLDADGPHEYFLQLNDRACDVPAPCAPIVASTDRLVLHDCRLDRK